MVRSGQRRIAEVNFRPPRRQPLGVEALTLAELRRREDPARLRAPHRVEFHQVLLVTAGRGRHTVDFVDYPCVRGTLLWVQPGQVQRYGLQAGLEARLVLFTPAFPLHPAGAGPEGAVRPGPVHRQLDGAERATIGTVLDQIAAECARPDGSVSAELLQHLVAVLLLHLDRLAEGGAGGAGGGRRAAGETYARFRQELERSYRTTRRAGVYAARLGYGVKTLSRVCLDATGHPVKQVIDARVVLEAKRLLAHTDEPVARISRQLGFSEATNFGKFFARHAGATPAAFRRMTQGQDR